MLLKSKANEKLNNQNVKKKKKTLNDKHLKVLKTGPYTFHVLNDRPVTLNLFAIIYPIKERLAGDLYTKAYQKSLEVGYKNASS